MTVLEYKARVLADVGLELSAAAVTRGLARLEETRKKITKQARMLCCCSWCEGEPTIRLSS
jgi:hypothetical protein